MHPSPFVYNLYERIGYAPHQWAQFCKKSLKILALTSAAAGIAILSFAQRVSEDPCSLRGTRLGLMTLTSMMGPLIGCLMGEVGKCRMKGRSFKTILVTGVVTAGVISVFHRLVIAAESLPSAESLFLHTRGCTSMGIQTMALTVAIPWLKGKTPTHRYVVTILKVYKDFKLYSPVIGLSLVMVGLFLTCYRTSRLPCAGEVFPSSACFAK